MTDITLVLLAGLTPDQRSLRAQHLRAATRAIAYAIVVPAGLLVGAALGLIVAIACGWIPFSGWIPIIC